MYLLGLHHGFITEKNTFLAKETPHPDSDLTSSLQAPRKGRKAS